MPVRASAPLSDGPSTRLRTVAIRKPGRAKPAAIQIRCVLEPSGAIVDPAGHTDDDRLERTASAALIAYRGHQPCEGVRASLITRGRLAGTDSDPAVGIDHRRTHVCSTQIDGKDQVSHRCSSLMSCHPPSGWRALGWSPGALCVGLDGLVVLQDGLHDPPGRFHPVLAGEQPGVAAEGVVEESFVGLVAAWAFLPVEHFEGNGPAEQRVAGLLGLHLERDSVVRFQPESEVVGMGGAVGISKEHPGRTLELDDRLGHRAREPFACPDVPRHPGPSPRVDLGAERDERFGVEPEATPSSDR